jgi:hypothetical protein
VKTISLKKVSAVAVASLGFGLLSVVPVQAAISLPLWVDTATTVGGVAITADTATVTRTLDTQLNAAAVKTITAPAGSAIIFTVKTGGTFVTTNIIDMSINGVIVQSDTTLGTAATAVTTTRNLPTPATTTTYNYVLTVYETAGTTRAASTLTTAIPVAITVVAPSAFSASLSTAYLGGTSNIVTAALDSTSEKVPASSTAAVGTVNAGVIGLSIFNAKGVAMANADAALTLNASVSGPGYVRFDAASTAAASGYSASQCSATPSFNGTTIGRSISTTTVDAVGVITICADGNAGVATVTVSITDGAGVTAQVGTAKKVTFFGKATKLAVSAANYTIGKSGGATTGATTATSTTTPAIVIFQTDKDGVAANYATPTVVSSDVNVVASGSCAADGLDATYGYGIGYYDCSFTTSVSAKSGDKATLTFRIVDPAGDGTTYLTTTQAVTVGGSVSKETLSFDKTSYAAGEKMVITRTAVDSSGNPVFDGASVPAVDFTRSVGGSVGASTSGANKGGYIGGKKATSATSPTVFAPSSSGAFDGYMTSGNTTADRVTASASVTDTNAGLLTQIDALNAKIVALNALIAKIMKKLGVK